MGEQRLSVLVLVRRRDEVFKLIFKRRPLDRGSGARLAGESRLGNGRKRIGDMVGKSAESDESNKEVNEVDGKECVECLGEIAFLKGDRNLSALNHHHNKQVNIPSYQKTLSCLTASMIPVIILPLSLAVVRLLPLYPRSLLIFHKMLSVRSL